METDITLEVEEQLPVAYLQRVTTQIIRVFKPYLQRRGSRYLNNNVKQLKQELDNLFREFFQHCSQGYFSKHHALAMQTLDFITAYQEFERYKKNNLIRLLSGVTAQGLQLKKTRDDCFSQLEHSIVQLDQDHAEDPITVTTIDDESVEANPLFSHIMFLDDWYRPFADVEWLGFRSPLNYADMLQHKIQQLFADRSQWQSVKDKTESPYHAFSETILAAHEAHVNCYIHYGLRARRHDQVNHFIDIRYKLKALESAPIFDEYLEKLQRSPLRQDKFLLKLSIGAEDGPAFLLSINGKENDMGLGLAALTQVEVIGRINRKRRR